MNDMKPSSGRDSFQYLRAIRFIRGSFAANKIRVNLCAFVVQLFWVAANGCAKSFVVKSLNNTCRTTPATASPQPGRVREYVGPGRAQQTPPHHTVGVNTPGAVLMGRTIGRSTASTNAKNAKADAALTQKHRDKTAATMANTP